MREPAQLGDQLEMTFRSVGDGTDRVLTHRVIELSLGDIKANVVGFSFGRHGSLFLAMRAQGSFSGSSLTRNRTVARRFATRSSLSARIGLSVLRHLQRPVAGAPW